jgi:hypothetical protein
VKKFCVFPAASWTSFFVSGGLRPKSCVSSVRVLRHRPAAGSRLVGDDPGKLVF